MVQALPRPAIITAALTDKRMSFSDYIISLRMALKRVGKM
jgi:hypothetical protein